jgi:hypothetical protein
VPPRPPSASRTEGADWWCSSHDVAVVGPVEIQPSLNGVLGQSVRFRYGVTGGGERGDAVARVTGAVTRQLHPHEAFVSVGYCFELVHLSTG